MSVWLVGALVGGITGGGALGAFGAWWLHRATHFSGRALYALAPFALVLWLAALLLRSVELIVIAVPLAATGIAAAVTARRRRMAALGAGGELREFERQRVSLLRSFGARERSTRRARKARGERTRIVSQGELIRERAWPAEEPFVPMTVDGRGRIPCREGRHLLIVGATGSGKTVSARRWLLARILRDGVGALVADPKGDEGLAHDLQHAARIVGRPFILFDPLNPDGDRWNPLWSDDTGAVVSRLVAPISAGEGNARYYADLLQIHLGTVAAGLQAAGLWPANLPLLLDAAQLNNFERLLEVVTGLHGEESEIVLRLTEHRTVIGVAETRRDLTGGILRLRVVAGESWRRTLTPDPVRGAVTLPAALRSGAVVLLRSWVDDLPDEARAITTLFLADAAAAALTLPEGTEWVALIDEFGGVLSGGTGDRALALLQRARSAGGQVALSAQSIVDPEVATGTAKLIDSLADNFAGGIFHRLSSPESRDWVARLIGTREVWQSTDRTEGGGAYAQGAGSRRRVREFRARPDDFTDLRVGEAFVWSTLGQPVERLDIAQAVLPDSDAPAAATDMAYRLAGPTVLPATTQTITSAAAQVPDDGSIDGAM